MKYSISARRTKILLWVLVILQAFFSYSLIPAIFIRHTIKSGLFESISFWFILFVPVFLLWAYYQTKKQNNKLFKFCLVLSLSLILVRLISLALHFAVLGTIYILIYVDFAMFFKSKITKIT